jgi:hypothetical protein
LLARNVFWPSRPGSLVCIMDHLWSIPTCSRSLCSPQANDWDPLGRSGVHPGSLVLPNLSPCVLRGLVNIPSTESSVPGPFGVASIIRGLPHSPSWPCIAGSARLRAFLQSPASADPAFIWQDRQTIRRTLTTPNNMGGLGHVVIGNSNSISINSQNPISE